jgi:hypothetical protein
MADAGFTPSLEQAAGQPGTWLREVTTDRGPVIVPVDLLVPQSFGGGGRRGARIPPHDKLEARKVPGLEAALLDNDPMRIESLEPDVAPRRTPAMSCG